MEIIRVVNLNIDSRNPAKPRYYHWGIVENGENSYAVVDFFDTSIHTTKEWENNPKLRAFYKELSGVKEGTSELKQDVQNMQSASKGKYLNIFLPMISNPQAIAQDRDGKVYIPFTGTPSDIASMFNNPSGYNFIVDSDSDKTQLYNTFEQARKAEPDSNFYVGFLARDYLYFLI